jgi:hypothetical protein
MNAIFSGSGLAAAAEAAAHLGLVADAHLTHFDAGPEFLDEHFQELAEVDPALGGEEERQLAAVK